MPPTQSCNALIIEDDRVFRTLISKKLVAMGHGVRAAENGQEGLEMLKEEKPDIILLDIIMPKTDGFEVLRSIQQSKDWKNIPVVVLSVLGQDQDIKAAKDLGAIDYIIKSTVSMDEAMEKVLSYCP